MIMFLQEISLHISTVCFVKYDHGTFLINHAHVILKDIQFRSRFLTIIVYQLILLKSLPLGIISCLICSRFFGFCAMLAICAEAL